MAEFDFNSLLRPTMKVTLPDKDRTELNVFMPSKEFYDLSLEIKKSPETVTDMSIIYSLVARILSNNKENTIITSDFLIEECHLELDDTVKFFNEYVKWTVSETNAKN